MESLKDGLAPFVGREFTRRYKGQGPRILQQLGVQVEDARQPFQQMDTAALLKVMLKSWNEVYRDTLGHSGRNLVSELLEVRNDWAHQGSFSSDDTYRALDSTERLLTAVSAPQADEIGKLKQELLRVRFDEQARSQRRRSADTAVESQATGTLRPVARGDHAAPGRAQRPLSAGGVRGGPLAGASGRGGRRVPGCGGVLPSHLPDGQPQAAPGQGPCGAWSAVAAIPWCSYRRTSEAARPHSMLALYHLFSGTSPAGLDGRGRDHAGERRTEVAGGEPGGPGRQPDIAGQSGDEGRRHGSADSVGGACLAARVGGGRAGGGTPRVRAGAGRRRTRDEPRGSAARPAQSSTAPA